MVGAKVARDAITPIDRILQPVSEFSVYRQIKLIDRSYMKWGSRNGGWCGRVFFLWISMDDNLPSRMVDLQEEIWRPSI